MVEQRQSAEDGGLYTLTDHSSCQCSVRCPQRRQSRYMALPNVQELGAPRFAVSPRLSCSFPYFFLDDPLAKTPRSQRIDHLTSLWQIGFMLCLACFAPWRETFFPTS